MKYKILIMFIGINVYPLNLASAKALTLDSFVASSNQKTSSKGVKFEYVTDQFDLGYPYTFEEESGFGVGFGILSENHRGPLGSFDFQKISLTCKKKYSINTLFVADINLYRIQSSKINTHSGVTGELSMENLLFNNTFLSKLSIKKEHLIESSLFRDLGGERLTSRGVRWDNLILAGNQHRIKSYIDHKWFNDKNRRVDIDFQYMYGLSANDLWIWVGLGSGFIFNDKTSIHYWSPRKELAVGPRYDLSIPVYKELSFISGASFNRFRENDLWGNGFYASAGFRYGKREDKNISLMGIRNESLQNGSKWQYNRIELNANIFF